LSARSSTERTAICRRRCRRGNWSPRWRRCVPARRLSAMFRRGHAAPSGGLARPWRRAQRSRVGDPGPHYAGQEQCRRRQTDIPQPQHGEVVHPHDLPKDRRRQSDSSGLMGRRAWFHTRPSSNRTMARRPIDAEGSEAFAVGPIYSRASGVEHHRYPVRLRRAVSGYLYTAARHQLIWRGCSTRRQET
jgi:hypothetical protein